MNPESLVVGIGASAGGLEALERFFRALPSSIDAAFVVVQHLSPDHKSLMAELLGKHTALPVHEAVDGQPLRSNTVTVVPPTANLELDGHRICFRVRSAGPSPNLPINLFFESLATTFGERAVGIVLSGTGSDGRLGSQRIKEAGGLVLVQDPSTARFDGMPLATIATGLADAVVAPEAMPAELTTLLAQGPMPAPPNAGDLAAMAEIHRLLQASTGIDFAEYKQATVRRRLARRMLLVGAPSLPEYAGRLAVDPAELQTLCGELLINVTEFFRDPDVFQLLEHSVLPSLVAQAGAEMLRVWVPGCSTGQEIYSFAMLLAEAAPRGGFKLFGTDVDRPALDRAAAGRYAEAELVGVSPARLSRFFRRDGDSFEVDRELRRRIVFAPHNVAKDPPFTRIDLVSCRNLLIYLTSALQRRVISTLAFSLRSEGVLVLGSSESLGEAAHRFRTLDGQRKIFQRLPGAGQLLAETPIPATNPRPTYNFAPSEAQQAVDAATRLLLDRVIPAAVLVNDRLELVRVFGNAEKLLSLPTGPASLGLVSLLPAELQTLTSLATHRALQTNGEVTMASADEAAGGVRAVHVQPFVAGRGAARYLVVSFERAPHATGAGTVPALPEDATRQVGELQQELSFVRESLQATVEALETSNEELQATNEELLASNEELQSANEELQSVNEELNTVNAEHQAKIRELTEANADLDNLFNSTSVGTLFLDEQLRVRRFTPPIAQQFSLLERDLGRSIEHITHQFSAVDLVADLRHVLRSAQIVERELHTTTGLRFVMRASPYLTLTRQVRGVVASFVETTSLRLEQEVRQRLQQVIDSLVEEIAVIGQAGDIRFVNRAWTRFATANSADPAAIRLGVGVNYLDACRSVPEIRAGLAAVLQGEQEQFSIEYPCHSATEQRWFMLHAARLADGDGAVISHVDVTRRHLEEAHG